MRLPQWILLLSSLLLFLHFRFEPSRQKSTHELASTTFDETLQTSGSKAAWKKAEAVLASTALTAFQEELPDRWYSFGDAILRPLVSYLPDSIVNAEWFLTRHREYLLEDGVGLIRIPEDSSKCKSLHRKWHSWVKEACRVLGLEQSNANLTQRGEIGNQAALCPELWVDEAWPPSPSTPSEYRKEPVWSLPVLRPSSRGIIVLQATILKDFPIKEAKALIGYELARSSFLRLPSSLVNALLPAAIGKRALQAVLIVHAYQKWDKARKPPAAIQALLGGPIRGSRQYSRSSAEWRALSELLKRLVPLPLQPFAFGKLLARGEQVNFPGARELRRWQRARRRSRQGQAVASFTSELLLLTTVRGVLGSRGRSLVLTLDRAAALVAGDVHATAAAILRVKGLLPRDVENSPELLEDCLEAFAASARAEVWKIRRESLLRNPKEPPPEVRVESLLQWSETESGQRLMALAQVRRSHDRRVSWVQAFRDYQRSQTQRDIMALARQELWSPRTAKAALILLLVLPFFNCIDPLRWASWCTFILAAFVFSLPWLRSFGAPSLPSLTYLPISVGLLMYSLIAKNIWWNHLLGGGKRWAELSGRLASQLTEQADSAAGIAYLTRDWAELARRSLATLDEELCGSWRTSLHELASKLADLRESIEDKHIHPQTSDQSSTSTPSSVVTGTDFGAPKQLAAWVGNLEASIPREPSREPLWLKVDRAVQRAAHVESARMRSALDATDPDQLQAMMTWWMTRDANSAASGGVSTARLLKEHGEMHENGHSNGNGNGSAKVMDAETLGSLLFSDRLHRRFPYPSFHSNGHSGNASIAEAPDGSEFERLERGLAQNLQALQELRIKLSPFEDKSRSKFWWHWKDVLGLAFRVRESLRMKAKAATFKALNQAGFHNSSKTDGYDSGDQFAEFTTLATLFLAFSLGMVGSFLWVLAKRWGWVMGSFAFGVANAVMLLNYCRLYLPHVRRQLERSLQDLSKNREVLLQEVQLVQKASRRAGMVHIRAHIFLQSVNVIRNINYLALCVKTEVQRNPAGEKRRLLARSGLQLLLAILPHSDPQWQRQALAGEDCRHLSRFLYERRPGQLASSYLESRKRLWLLFRMIHLSSSIPCEAQGQLLALAELFLRPVLVERRVPVGFTAKAAVLEDETTRIAPHTPRSKALLDSIDDEEEANTVSHQHARSTPRNRAGCASDAGSVDSDDRFSFCGASTVSMSNVSRTSSSRPVDVGKALKRLTATRGDISRVLARLPHTSLLSQSACSSEAEAVLNDIFSSIVLLVPASYISSQRSAGTAAVATGYRFGARPYVLRAVSTSLELRAMVEGPREVIVPISEILDEEPASADIFAVWSSLSALMPTRFNEASLSTRRHRLKRAKDAIRSLSSVREQRR